VLLTNFSDFQMTHNPTPHKETRMTFDEWVAGGQRVRLNGHSVFVRQDGPTDGKPVTLIHGYPTSSHDWNHVIPGLVSAGCQITSLDLLGFGASDKPRDHDNNLVEQAALVQAAWAHLGIDTTALVTHDMGVSVAQELLATDASRISRAAFLNGGLYPAVNRPPAIQRLFHSPLGRFLGPLFSERAFCSGMRRVLGRPVSDAELHEMWLAISAGGGATIQHRLVSYIDDRAANDKRWTNALETYPGPTLFIWGPADPVCGPVLSRIRDRVPGARITVLDGDPATGHYPQVENPSAVLAVLAPFLAGGAASPAVS
jgi:pimeloyl-ACP methyl ester carboxylesterase